MVLLCYSLCPSLFVFQFQSGFCPIPALYAKFPAFYANNFPPSSSLLAMYVGGSPKIIYGCGHRERAKCVNKGLSGKVVLAAKTLMRV